MECKEYVKRDFIYNSGLVNAFMYLQSDDDSEYLDDNIIFWKGIKVELKSDRLIFHTNEESLLEVYRFLIRRYYEEIMEQTNNERLYVTPDLKDVIKAKKINKKPFAGRGKIDKLQDIYGVTEVDGETFLKLAQIYEKKVAAGEFKSKLKFWHGEQKKSIDKLKKEAEEGKSKKVDVYRKVSEIVEILSDYVEDVDSGTNCTVCGSKYTTLKTKSGEKKIVIESQNFIYDFGNSTPVNRDHRMKYEQPLCFMCDMFYRLGMLYNYYYNNTVFMFDSASLLTLKRIKEELGIANDYIPIPKSNSKTNIDGASNYYFYKTNSMMFNILLLIYQKAKDKEKLVFDLGASTLVKMDVSSDSVDNSVFYNKLSQNFKLFKKLENEGLCCGKESFIKILLSYVYWARKSKDEYPKYYEDLNFEFLNFLPVEDTLCNASYAHLIKEREGGKNLKNFSNLKVFLKIYNVIKGGEKMGYEDVLEICSAVGERIGYFAADADEKTLVYQIREIGNIEKLIEFFKDFEYSVLKYDRGDILNAVNEDLKKRYSELIQDILELAKDRKNIPLIRDILGIFAVQKYMAVKYAKNKGGN